MVSGLCHNRPTNFPDLPAGADGEGTAMRNGFTFGENP